MTERKDFYSFLSADQKRALADEYAAGPKPLVRMGQHWGDGASVICAGDERQAQAAARKRFADKFHAKPCPNGYYGKDHGGDALPTVHERLVAEGYLAPEVEGVPV